MRRRDFITTGGLGLAGSMLAAPAIAQSRPPLTWRMATSWPKSLDALFGSAEFISKRVAEATDDKFQIQVFAGGEIVPALQVLDAVQDNTVESGHTASYYYIGKDPTFGLDCTIPFGMNARQMNAWMTSGGGWSCCATSSRITTSTTYPPETPGRRWAAGFARRSRRSRICRD